ncbi:MAG: DUF6531 domain-containing protein [Firmicutes bacterium]|nr:DUF6531 domain-containing protein [Bacillota bacterium]
MESFWSYYSKDLGTGWKYLINTFTGNLVIQKGLVSIPGRGTGLGEGLVYNSLSTQAGVVGVGWQLTSDLFVKENADGSVTFKDGDATNHRFTKNADGTYTAPDGINLKLTKVDAATFTIKDQANNVFRFQNGLLVSIKDEKGNTTSFSYDASSRLSVVTDPSGRKLSYYYGANGKLASITDPANRTISFGYDASARLISVTDPKGGATRFAYDGSNRMISITDANGRITSFVYDASGRTVKVKDARSNQSKEYATTLAYDTSLLKTTITDPAGKSVTYTHNSTGNAVEVKSAAEETDYSWDKNDLVSITDASGSTSASYDANGNVTSISDTINSNANAKTSISYDGANNPTTVTDPNNNQVTAKYDLSSNKLSSSNLARKEADANTYDSYGNLTSATEPGAPTYNFLQNGSFEWTDSYGRPQFWTRGGATSAISVDKTVAFYGNASVRIKSLSQTIAYLYSREVSVVAGQKLTLSVPIKMEGVSGAGGVDAGIEYYDANWNYVGSDYTDLYLGTGTDKLMIASTAPTGAVYAIVVLELWNASGTVWFDGAQLESPVNSTEGHILTRFDYVENSSFEAGGTY